MLFSSYYNPSGLGPRPQRLILFQEKSASFQKSFLVTGLLRERIGFESHVCPLRDITPLCQFHIDPFTNLLCHLLITESEEIDFIVRKRNDRVNRTDHLVKGVHHPFPGFRTEGSLSLVSLIPKLYPNQGEGGFVLLRLFHHFIENQIVDGIDSKQGKGEDKGRAGTQFTFRDNRSLMTFDDLLGNS